MKRKKYKQMVEDINNIVDNDWGFEIDCHSLPNSKPFSQEESEEMANALMRIYSISHGVYCGCGNKYISK